VAQPNGSLDAQNHPSSVQTQLPTVYGRQAGPTRGLYTQPQRSFHHQSPYGASGS
jgi:hypothetical protein